MQLRHLILMFTGLVLLVSCAGPKPIIATTDFADKTRSVRKVGVVMAGTWVYELGVRGARTLNKEWSDKAETNLAKASVEQLRSLGYEVKLIAGNSQSQEIVEAFNKVPREQLSRYVYSGNPLDTITPEMLGEFMVKEDVDALVLVKGIDHVLSSGRQTMRVVGALLGVVESSGIAHAEFGLLNRQSVVLYYGHKYEDGKDLRTEEGADHLVAELVDELKELLNKKL